MLMKRWQPPSDIPHHTPEHDVSRSTLGSTFHHQGRPPHIRPLHVGGTLAIKESGEVCPVDGWAVGNGYGWLLRRWRIRQSVAVRLNHVMSVDHNTRLHVGPLWIEPRVVIYATLIQMTAYALFDVPDIPISVDGFNVLFWVAIVPMFALAVAHAFSEVLDLQIRLPRRMNWSDVVVILHANLQFLYVSLVPIILLSVAWLLGMSANSAVNIVLYFCLVSLAGWGAYGARQAGLRAWPCVMFGAAYACLGAFIVLLEIFIRH